MKTFITCAHKILRIIYKLLSTKQTYKNHDHRQTGGWYQDYKLNHQPAPKNAAFHFVQSLLLLTRYLPLKEALVLLITIPKGILIFFYTRFIQSYIMLYSFSNFHTREEIIHWIISLTLNTFLNCGFIKPYLCLRNNLLPKSTDSQTCT